MQNREQATQLYNAAVAAVQPANLIPQYIEVKPDGIHIAGEHIQTNKQSVIVIGAGKAASAMAQTTEAIRRYGRGWPGRSAERR